MYFPCVTVSPEVVTSVGLFAHSYQQESRHFSFFCPDMLYLSTCFFIILVMLQWPSVCSRQGDGGDGSCSPHLFHLSGKETLHEKLHRWHLRMIHWLKLDHLLRGSVGKWVSSLPVPVVGGDEEAVNGCSICQGAASSTGNPAVGPWDPVSSNMYQSLQTWAL